MAMFVIDASGDEITYHVPRGDESDRIDAASLNALDTEAVAVALGVLRYTQRAHARISFGVIG